jgi:hypothetical protein
MESLHLTPDGADPPRTEACATAKTPVGQSITPIPDLDGRPCRVPHRQPRAKIPYARAEAM